ncbi:DUF885 domain-containing protein [Mangrovimicrobium sediminis]|uniref:DUF885 domain-containing protein n=1 Tax=Mangrovimicrobium sediminis TaxID=2562682 RepID=A0A4Z0M704_9GAMM|nr:DUF885 domain-containing protein [Haliea sp. SAOS-164]TGD75167.1 DUF885 domain-containing protein [Haliea sp. SAOS-164]
MSLRLLGAVIAAVTALALSVAPVFAEPPSKPAAMSDSATASAQARELFAEIWAGYLSRDPEEQTDLGIKDDYDKWKDYSSAALDRELAQDKADLALLEAIDSDTLDAATALSHRLYSDRLRAEIDDYRWRYYKYPVDQMRGKQSEIPAFLINKHRIDSSEDAAAYIARLNGISGLIDQVIERLELSAENGIVPPDFVLPHVLSDARNLISGAPFDGGEPSPLLADFSDKIGALEISAAERSRLLREAETALLESVQPAYRRLIAEVEKLQKSASHDAGVWRLPDGDAYYANRLRYFTTTDLSAEQIHALGLAEVKRIHGEMRAIKDKVGFEGSLNEFMQHLREADQFYYPDTDEGRAQYLAKANAVLDDMRERLPELFLTLPKAPLVVKAVEPFREKSTGKAFYTAPAADGSRPGIYYANLYDMRAMPTYQLEALAYHEGLPGHHMQIAIKQELEELPDFRRFQGYTAYSEGWGLYSEALPKEIGLYQDPYSDFGRLAMELWRAVRLVVDTGMHAKRWSREQSIEFYVANTPNARSDAVKMVERHAVMPGQATAYKVGMLKIVEEREKARAALGDRFDLRAFHDVVLRNGAVPLYVLEEQVDAYIAANRAP